MKKLIMISAILSQVTHVFCANDCRQTKDTNQTIISKEKTEKNLKRFEISLEEQRMEQKALIRKFLTENNSSQKYIEYLLTDDSPQWRVKFYEVLAHATNAQRRKEDQKNLVALLQKEPQTTTF